MWVGIPKDAIHWKADRDLLGFLNCGILEYDGKDEAPAPIPTDILALHAAGALWKQTQMVTFPLFAIPGAELSLLVQVRISASFIL